MYNCIINSKSRDTASVSIHWDQHPLPPYDLWVSTRKNNLKVLVGRLQGGNAIGQHIQLLL